MLGISLCTCPVAISAPSQSQMLKFLNSSTASKAHRVLYIPEIIERVVIFLDSQSIMAVRMLSSAWRATVAVVLGSAFRSHYPCAPIDYYEKIPPGLNWMPPIETEISDMSREVFDRSKIFDFADSAPSESYSEQMCHPACWSQAECLPEALWFAFRKLWNFYHSHQAIYSPLLSLKPFDNR
jgi:hypothetical protein